MTNRFGGRVRSALALTGMLVLAACGGGSGGGSSTPPTPTYAVTYDGNGHSSGTPPVDGKAYLPGDTATVPANSGSMTKTEPLFHSSFAGWNTLADGSGTSRAPASTLVMAAADVTLYAKWALSTTVTTLAGAAPGADGTGGAARFVSPFGVVREGPNLFVADEGTHTIRKIVIATGVVTTLAGTVGESGFADGTGSAAKLGYPRGLASDGTNLYVSDYHGQAIRKVVISSGEVSTLAGKAFTSGAADGIGVAARFAYPSALATDGTNLYVADTDNHTIRKIVIATAEVTTLAGTAGVAGSADGTGSAASFSRPMGITTDGTNLFVSDTNNDLIRQIVIATGVVSTLAGSVGNSGTVTDGTGTAARFFRPNHLTTDGTNLYVAGNYDQSIRKIVIGTRVVTTLAGNSSTGTTDAVGAAARFDHPRGIATDGINLYVADNINHKIRVVAIASRAVTSLAGAGASAEGIGRAAAFNLPTAVTAQGGNLYVADEFNHTVRKIVIATGEVSTFAGQAGQPGNTDGVATVARFFRPSGIASDANNLYVADSLNHVIRQIVIATGVVTTLGGGSGPNAIATDGSNLYVVGFRGQSIDRIVIATGAVSTLTASGFGAGVATNFSFGGGGLCTDGTTLYAAEGGRVLKIVIATGAVSVLAGGGSGHADGTGNAAGFGGLGSMVLAGNYLYVADMSNNTIRRVEISTRRVVTVAGTAGVKGFADGADASASFSDPSGLAIDGQSLFVSDLSNNTIRQIH